MAEQLKDLEQATRYNTGKLRWTLIDWGTMEELVKVLEYGIIKYAIDDWKKGMPTTEVSDSLLRHLTSYLQGEDNDKESGLPHTGHILCNAMFLAFMHKYKPEFDSRKNQQS